MASAQHNQHGEKRTLFYIIGIILAVIGLGLSLYSTFHHMQLKATGATDAVCNINAAFSCDDVARSSFSEIFGIPLGVYGIGYFLAMITLLGTAMIKDEYRRDTIHAYAVLSAIGLITSLILGGISLFSLQVGCVVCMGIYAVTLLQGLNIAFNRQAIPSGWSMKSVTNGGSYALLALAVAISVYQLIKPAPSTVKLDTPQTAHEHDGGSNRVGPKQDIKIDRSDFSGMGQDYRRGAEDAKVEIVEFADFECPACKTAAFTLKQMKEQYGDKIQVVFKNYPLDPNCNPGMQRPLHDFACDAARVARCAGRVGKFWEMHDKIYENQTQLSRQNLTKWAKELGLSDADIQACRESKDILAKLQDDINLGSKLGVDSTPTVFINGRKVISPSADNIRREIESAL